MAANTATGAGKENARAITFKNQMHKDFYMQHLQKCGSQDVYHKAFIYCLGIDRDTREHADRIYDFTSGCVKPECLHEGWQTSGSRKIVRMAFNLYCNGTPSVFSCKSKKAQSEECQLYTVDHLFYSGYAKYFQLCGWILQGASNHLSIRKNRAGALLHLLTQPFFAH